MGPPPSREPPMRFHPSLFLAMAAAFLFSALSAAA